MTLKVGIERDIEIDKRFVQHVRSHAIGDVFDAAVELITNVDDSYGRLYRSGNRPTDGGEILIEHIEQRKGQPSMLIIRDRAEGMDDRDMEAKLARIGSYSSTSGDRGYMGRGAKDCTELGALTIESIKDNRYHRCRITPDLKFCLEARTEKATPGLRRSLGIERGNGTTATLVLKPGVRIPRVETLAADLPKHYALRDIMAPESESRVLLRRPTEKKPERLTYHQPEGDLVVSELFEVEGYPSAKATLKIWRCPEVLGEARPRFEPYGLLVKGRRAIHECSLLSDELKRDPYTRRFFGRLECPFLDELLLTYQKRLERAEEPGPDNPCLVLDPNRRFGLERRHPFVTALLKTPVDRLRKLVAAERERESASRREVANEETRARLAKLAKLASRFLQEQLDELEELGQGEDVENDAFSRRGILIYPTYLRVGVGRERSLTIYVRREALTRPTESVRITTDGDDALQLSDSLVTLRPHASKPDRLIGSFRVKGVAERPDVVITASCEGMAPAEALVQIVPITTENREFGQPLEFERHEYRVRESRQRALKLFAKSPDLVSRKVEVKVTTSDPHKVAVRGGCTLTPVAGTNYAEGKVVVQGRALKAHAVVTAEVGSHSATARVKVIEKADEGVPIAFEIRDEDFGNFRAIWADREGKPNLLLISARHASLKRYLGDPAQNFPGQDSALFRSLIAEIVAEALCRKTLALEAKERPFDFSWADMAKPQLIVDDVFAQLHRRLTDFVARAHDVMLSDEDLEASEVHGRAQMVARKGAAAE